MRRWRAVLAFPVLVLPACLDAQPARRAIVQAGPRASVMVAREFAGLSYGASATAVWRSALRGRDVRGELAFQQGDRKEGDDESTLFGVPSQPVRTHVSVTTVALTVNRRRERGADQLSQERSYLFGGAALALGRVRQVIGPTPAGCILGLVCSDAEPARTVRERIVLPALTFGRGVGAGEGAVGWFGELQLMHTFGAGFTAVSLAIGLRF